MKWIPVKDRLPEVSKMVYEGSKWMQPIGFADYFLLSDWVLVTADADSSDGDDTEIFVAQYEDDLDGRTYWTTIGAGLLNNVTAWMPLPQPYKADRKTENSSEKPNNCEYAKNPSGDVWECGCFLDTYCEHQIYDRNPDGTINIVECGYEPKDESTISKMEQVEPQTCSFSDCDNFKNPDYERCIECKRKQIKLKTEQTEREGE